MNFKLLLACILVVGIANAVQARELKAQCAAGDASCWCAAKGATGTFPDTTASCTKYYECVSPTQSYYRNCPSETSFNDSTKRCEWSEQVQCTAKDTGPTTTVIFTPPPPRKKRRPPPPSRQRKSPPPPKRRSPPPPRKRPPPLKPVSPSPSPISPSPSTRPPPSNPSTNNYAFVGYFQSWSDPWSSSAAVNNIANIPSYVNYVILSFMRPDSSYTGGVTFAGTGLDFSSDPSVIKAAIALLKSRNPKTKVLVAVGGATYTNFNNLNAAAIADFVEAFNLDGVDLDYEPTNPNCGNFGPNFSCTTDSEYINSVKALRAALPRPLLLTTAAWSTGAFGQGDFIGAQPAGQYSGVAVNMLKSVGNMLDMVNIMSYDAGTTYDPKQAFSAYASLYDKSKLTLGVEVAPEAWGGHVISLTEVSDLASFVKTQGGAGMMMWSLQKQAGEGPTGFLIASTACVKLGSRQCTCPLLSTQQC